MKVHVWDTYVKKKDGDVLHFDILVSDEFNTAEKVYEFGMKYLALQNLSYARIDAEACKLCHFEEATAEIEDSIAGKGYHIIEMENIPLTLSENPSRRESILHLRGHFADFRFIDFRNMSDDEVRKLVTDNK